MLPVQVMKGGESGWKSLRWAVRAQASQAAGLTCGGAGLDGSKRYSTLVLNWASVQIKNLFHLGKAAKVQHPGKK